MKELDLKGEFSSPFEHHGKCVSGHYLAEKPNDDPTIHSHYYRDDRWEFDGTNDDQGFR